MTDDLVKRLLQLQRSYELPASARPLVASAAKHIEQQAAEIARLKDLLWDAGALIGQSVPMDTAAFIAGKRVTAQGVWLEISQALKGQP